MQEPDADLDITAAGHYTRHAHYKRAKVGARYGSSSSTVRGLVCDYFSVSPVVLGWSSVGFGGFRSYFVSLLFFAPLHILILRIRDAAFSLLILLLSGKI